MKYARRFLATVALGALSVVTVQSFVPGEGNADARRQCYWVKGIGVVCDTPDDTITL